MRPLLLLALLAPLAAGLAEPPLVPQDDAGSGRDAPGGFPGHPIVPGKPYRGSLDGLTDARDVYQFHALAGESLQARLRAQAGCLGLHGPGGALLGAACASTGELLTLDARAAASGTHHLRVAAYEPLPGAPLAVPVSYGFSVGLNESAPVPPEGLTG